LRPKYAILPSRRIVLVTPDETELPAQRISDVRIVAYQPGRESEAAGVAVAPQVANALLPEPTPHVTVEIRDRVGRALVAAIEVLSPTNKRGDGHEEYAGKRQEYLRSDAHLIEIDLIRVGERFPLDRPLPDTPYFIFVARANRRPKVEFWPVSLRAPLPPVPIPLRGDDPDATLDLQAALTTIYDLFAFDELVDYSGPPPGPLTPDDAAWVEERLREAGRRS
jgi:hypothetical protein